jgi:hypothetical protein
MRPLVYNSNVSCRPLLRMTSADILAVPRMSHDNDSDSELEDEEDKDERITRVLLHL